MDNIRTFIHFVINGNPKNKKGNPVPKAKLTKGQQWTEKARDYVAWKKYVVDAFLVQTERTMPELGAMMRFRVEHAGEKPIPSLSKKAKMAIVAVYKNHKHPDTENVFGSIADALFENDAKLSGEFDYDVHPTNHGFVSVTLYFSEDLWDTLKVWRVRMKSSQRSKKRANSIERISVKKSKDILDSIRSTRNILTRKIG